jgi:putative Ca2+/H+ antiporter (TMEM165/GDT1 family)
MAHALEAVTNSVPLVRVVDHASQQTDRWLFIVTLVAFGVWVWIKDRYQTKRNEQLVRDSNKIRADNDRAYKKVISEQNRNVQRVINVVEINTECLREATMTLSAIRASGWKLKRVDDHVRRELSRDESRSTKPQRKDKRK